MSGAISELSQIIATSLSRAMRQSVDPAQIEVAIRSHAVVSSDPFDADRFVREYLEEANVSKKRITEHAWEWHGVYRLFQASAAGVTRDPLEIFQRSVDAALKTVDEELNVTHKSIAPSWERFRTDPSAQGNWEFMVTALAQAGVHKRILLMLSNARRHLFSEGMVPENATPIQPSGTTAPQPLRNLQTRPTSQEMAPPPELASVPHPIDVERAEQPLTVYAEMLDDWGNLISAPPATPAKEGIPLSAHRTEEQRLIIEQMKRSPITVAAIADDADVDRSFVGGLVRRFPKGDFSTLRVNAARPDMPKILHTFSDPHRRGILIVEFTKASSTNGVEGIYNATLIDYLRQRFFTPPPGEYFPKRRLLVVVRGNGWSAEAAGHSMRSFLRHIAQTQRPVPGLAINPQQLNKRQTADYLFGPGAWEGKSAKAFRAAVDFYHHHLPALPSVLAEFLLRMKGVKRLEEFKELVRAFAKERHRQHIKDIQQGSDGNAPPLRPYGGRGRENSDYYNAHQIHTSLRYRVSFQETPLPPFSDLTIEMSPPPSQNRQGGNGASEGNGSGSARTNGGQARSAKGAPAAVEQGAGRFAGFGKEVAPPPQAILEAVIGALDEGPPNVTSVELYRFPAPKPNAPVPFEAAKVPKPIP